MTRSLLLSGGFTGTVWTSLKGLGENNFFPLSKVVGVLGGTVSSKCIGSVFDFFIGKIGRLGGGFGGLRGTESEISGGDKSPLDIGDSGPLELGDNNPEFGVDKPFEFGDITPFAGLCVPLVEPLCSGMWILSWLELVPPAATGPASGACGIVVTRCACVSRSGGSNSRGERPVPFQSCPELYYC